MLKVIDPVRWEAMLRVVEGSCRTATFGGWDIWADAAVELGLERGWLAEVPDEPEPPTSQWRPLAEAAGSGDLLLVGVASERGWKKALRFYHEAVVDYYTHYLPIPEPPAREGVE
jgi:hypothetical protein